MFSQDWSQLSRLHVTTVAWALYSVYHTVLQTAVLHSGGFSFSSLICQAAARGGVIMIIGVEDEQRRKHPLRPLPLSGAAV